MSLFLQKENRLKTDEKRGKCKLAPFMQRNIMVRNFTIGAFNNPLVP